MAWSAQLHGTWAVGGATEALAVRSVGARRWRPWLEAAVALLALALSSCTIIPIVDLYNDAPTQIRVLVENDTYSIEPASMESFDYPSADWGTVRVCLDGSLLQYVIPYPPTEYYRTGLFRGRIRVQLGGDGRIWILKPDDVFPLSEDAEQPGPFPLVPEQAGACE